MIKLMNQKGFSPILVIAAVVIILITGGVIYNRGQQASDNDNKQQSNSSVVTSPSTTPISFQESISATITKTPSKISTPTSKPTSTPVQNLTQAQPTPTPSSSPTSTPTPSRTCNVVSNTAPTPPQYGPPKVICEVHGSLSGCDAPTTANFYYGAASYNSQGYVTNVQWDFDGDGVWDTPMNLASQNVNHVYNQPDNYTIKMHLQTSDGLTSDICTGSVAVY